MRKKRAKKRYLTPDSKFNSQLATRFVNNIMLDGKKNVAFKIFYEALDGVSQKIDDSESIKVWEKALENVMPHVEVRSRRVGGATYQVPMEVRSSRSQALAIRWLIDASRKRSENTMIERLSNEIMDASSSRGLAIKKREDTHKMADANKAFAHYRW